MERAYQAPPIPNAFIWRRAHSLTGLWLVLFLIEHLFTNSQAALWLGEDDLGFVRAVNSLRELPYLQVIEIVFLGIPFLIHGIWGIKYLMTAKYNSFGTDGSTPVLHYPRNHAYTWQRITAWILLFAIVAHVIHMRFIEYPASATLNAQQHYLIRVGKDEGLHKLSKHLGFSFFDRQQLETEKKHIRSRMSSDGNKDSLEVEQQETWLAGLKNWTLNDNQVIVVAPSFGVAELLMVRNAFKNPIMVLLYTGLVLAACFHGFNGLWTFMISWGVTLTARSQQLMRSLATGLMVLIAFLGLAAVWLSYWMNLR